MLIFLKNKWRIIIFWLIIAASLGMAYYGIRQGELGFTRLMISTL